MMRAGLIFSGLSAIAVTASLAAQAPPRSSAVTTPASTPVGSRSPSAG